MRFLPRRSGPREAVGGTGVAAFWAWWRAAAVRIEAVVAGGGWGDLTGELREEISARVDAIAAGLEWEIGPGRRARHCLVVSAAGRPELRAAAQRWWRAAPPSGKRWEFYPARQPDPGFTAHRLHVDGHELGLADLRFAVADAPGRQLDVTVRHPGFARLDAGDRDRFAALALDQLLGEDAATVWIATVTTTDAGHATDSADTLRTAVQRLLDSEPAWAMLGGTNRAGTRLATVQIPLVPARWPSFDHHVQAVLDYPRTRDSGLPTIAAFDALQTSRTPCWHGWPPPRS